jgi:MFS family permease
MRAAILMTLGMGLFFTGVMTVLIPLAIRDLYGGGAQDIAGGFITTGAGTLITIALLTRRGGLRYPSRGMAIALLVGCCALLPLVLAPPKALFYVCIFIWGMCGGVVMSMSRTILQERSPGSHQSRVMAVLSLSIAGGNPLSALIIGLAVSAFTVRWAVILPISGVAVTTVGVLASHSIWQLRSRSHR